MPGPKPDPDEKPTPQKHHAGTKARRRRRVKAHRRCAGHESRKLPTLESAATIPTISRGGDGHNGRSSGGPKPSGDEKASTESPRTRPAVRAVALGRLQRLVMDEPKQDPDEKPTPSEHHAREKAPRPRRGPTHRGRAEHDSTEPPALNFIAPISTICGGGDGHNGGS